MVKPQQFQRAHGVMLFSGGAGFVANHLNLRHHAHGNFQPLAQATGRTGGVEKHPFIATGQGGQQVQHVGRCGYFAGSFHLVPNADAFPLGVDVFPAQRQHFAGCGACRQLVQIQRQQMPPVEVS